MLLWRSTNTHPIHARHARGSCQQRSCSMRSCLPNGDVQMYCGQTGKRFKALLTSHLGPRTPHHLPADGPQAYKTTHTLRGSTSEGPLQPPHSINLRILSQSWSHCSDLWAGRVGEFNQRALQGHRSGIGMFRACCLDPHLTCRILKSLSTASPRTPMSSHT